MKKAVEFYIDYEDINISVDQIGHIIGYQKTEIPESINDNINIIKKEIKDRCEIKGGFIICDEVEILNNSISISSKNFHTENIITNALKFSESIAVFVCTAGDNLSQWSSTLFNMHDPMKAYIVDIIASLIVEKSADIIQKKVENHSQIISKKTTNRYSPGYCGWPVSDQHELFSFLPYNFCGITLNETALMSPLKSISGFIGIGSAVTNNDYLCINCYKSDCILSNKNN